MQRIIKWLEGNQDFTEGVALYNELGSDNALKSLLNLGANSFTEKKLKAALEQLVPKSDPEPQKPKLPEKVREWFKKREVYHNNLFYTPSQSDRKKLCFAILAIGKKLDKYFNEDIIEADPIPISPEEGLPTNAWDMHQVFNNNRSYIAKNQKSVEKKGEIERRNTQNKLIEERMKNMIYGTV